MASAGKITNPFYLGQTGKCIWMEADNFLAPTALALVLRKTLLKSKSHRNRIGYQAVATAVVAVA